MDLALALTVFTTIFLLELPDKTFIATLVLATRYRPLLVWVGVASAFLVQTVIAVAFGGLLSALPEKPVQAVVLVLFVVAGVLILRGASHAKDESEEATEEFEAKATKDVHGLAVVSTCFLVLFLAEWGDLSQLATAGFAAHNGHPVSVGVGAFLALAVVSGLGAGLGRVLVNRIPLSTIRRVAGVVCLVLAAVMALQLLGVDMPAWLPV